VPDSMVFELGCWGEPAQVASQLGRFVDAAELTIIRPVVVSLPYSDTVREILRVVEPQDRRSGNAAQRG
jgi:hypothetical protein